jgi:predicted HTH domain antitoxin
METMNITIPNDLAFQIRSTPRYGSAVNDKLQMLLAIGLFASKEVSLAKAAELAGQSLVEFMGTLKFLGIPAVVYTEEMLEDDLSFANKVV